MIGSTNKHQRLEHRRGRGSPSLAAVCDAQVPAAHDKAQDGLTQVPGRFLPVRTGGGLAERSRLFPQFMCCAHFPQFERRRRSVRGCSLPAIEPVATNFCRALTSRGNSDAFKLSFQPRRQAIADLSSLNHNQFPFMESRSNDRDPIERIPQGAGQISQGRGNV